MTNENHEDLKNEETQKTSQDVDGASELENEESPAVELKKEEVDYKSKYFYLAAEFENFRKRTEKEKQNLLKFGNENVLTDIVEVVDNFDRTIEMLRSDEDTKMKNVVIGLDMVKKQFLDTMAKNGLSVIECLNKVFDPNFHEALAQEYQEGVEPNVVIKEFQKGYLLNGRVIRASKVVVSSNKQ